MTTTADKSTPVPSVEKTGSTSEDSGDVEIYGIQSGVLLKLFIHSMAMFSLPFVAYYLTKCWFEEYFEITTPTSYIWGVVAAVVMVHIVAASYIYQAFQEEKQDRKKK